MNLWSRHKEHSVGTSDLVDVLPFQIEKRSCCGFRTWELLGQHYNENHLADLGALERLKMFRLWGHQSSNLQGVPQGNTPLILHSTQHTRHSQGKPAHIFLLVYLPIYLHSIFILYVCSHIYSKKYLSIADMLPHHHITDMLPHHHITYKNTNIQAPWWR
jgi:hypothetical protein